MFAHKRIVCKALSKQEQHCSEVLALEFRVTANYSDAPKHRVATYSGKEIPTAEAIAAVTTVMSASPAPAATASVQ